MKSAVIRARVEPKLKEEVEEVLHDLGLTTSQAIILFFNQIKHTHSIPFELKVPNSITRKTIKDSRDGKDIKRFNSAEELFADLDM